MSIDITVFAIGWALGWVLLWRPRPLPRNSEVSPPRDRIAVVVPARDEERSLADLVPALKAQLRPGDELVVVDDHSSDATAELARAGGARVHAASSLPSGWLGKPHACHEGAVATTAPLLVFVDADVRPAPDLLDRIAAAVEDAPDAVISVQPWHATERFVEQFSVFANLVAVMGAGAFTALGRRVSSRVAFGPVLAIRRDVYDRVGGHADALVRTTHTEDIALARAVGRSELFTGRPDTSMRMYPRGLAQLAAGWTRSIATGARFTPWWIVLAVAAWIAALTGGPIVAPVVYPLCAFQVWVLGRRVAAAHPATAVLYPVFLVAFVVIFLRSAVAVVMRRDVTWKQRSVPARP